MGDQSAGKSSLLQSLTDIPFPVSDRLCTRFPTRIVSRRTPHQAESIRVSIEPSALLLFQKLSQESNIFSDVDQIARLDRLDRYAKFARTIPTLTAEGFREILNEVSLIPILITSGNVTDYIYLGRRLDGNIKTVFISRPK